MDTDFLVRLFGALFAIMNPFVSLPIFLSVCADRTPAEMRKVGLAVTFYSSVMCLVIAVGGQAILEFFGISVNDFRLAGGLVLLLIGLGMLNGKDSTAHKGTSAEQAQHADLENVAFYPLTFPIIVGPGTIATLVVFYVQIDSTAQTVAYGVGLASVLVILGLVLFFASAIGTLLSQTLRVIMTRLMGMILAAIATDMMISGLKVLLPGLAG